MPWLQLALPPCLWGDEPGLHPSILLPPNTPLVSIKKNINTYAGHCEFINAPSHGSSSPLLPPSSPSSDGVRHCSR